MGTLLKNINQELVTSYFYPTFYLSIHYFTRASPRPCRLGRLKGTGRHGLQEQVMLSTAKQSFSQSCNEHDYLWHGVDSHMVGKTPVSQGSFHDQRLHSLPDLGEDPLELQAAPPGKPELKQHLLVHDNQDRFEYQTATSPVSGCHGH